MCATDAPNLGNCFFPLAKLVFRAFRFRVSFRDSDRGNAGDTHVTAHRVGVCANRPHAMD
jgi:hypothetical protein